MSTLSTTHEGLERMLEGTRALSESVGPTRSLRAMPLVILTGIVTAIVALASRQFGDLIGDGFTGEWLALWAVGAVAAMVFARTAARMAGWLVASGRGLRAQMAQSRAEQAFLTAAQHDYRLQADLRAALSRSEG